MSATTSKAAQTPDAQNAMARRLIYSNAKPIYQMVTSKTFTNVSAGNNQLVVNPLQVGFLRRFIVEVTATISNTDTTHAANLTPNGADNLLTNITFADFTGNPRHNCSGRSLSAVEAAKYRRIPGAAVTSDSVSGYGSIVASNVAPTIAESSSVTVTRVFEVPVMVDTGHFMAGGMWLGVNNQSTLLTLTLNLAPIVLPAGDPTNAIYQLVTGGATIAATPITSCTIKVFQDYWNNVPQDKNGNPILPGVDIETAYMINETNSGMTFANGQPSAWAFPTFSKILGTYGIFDNAGVLNAGTDWTQLALVVSNYSIIKQYDPYTMSRALRDIIGVDLPKGMWGFITRMHPLDVTQYPSLQLQFTPSSASAGATMLITTELLRKVQYMGAASGMGST